MIFMRIAFPGIDVRIDILQGAFKCHFMSKLRNFDRVDHRDIVPTDTFNQFVADMQCKLAVLNRQTTVELPILKMFKSKVIRLHTTQPHRIVLCERKMLPKQTRNFRGRNLIFQYR